MTLGRKPRSASVAVPATIHVPSYAYNPPLPPAPQAPPGNVDGADASGESYLRQVPLPADTEVSVVRMVKAWRALDVYCSARMTGAGGTFITISVYAIVRGVRVLVGVGRYLRANTSTPLRVCAIRNAAAERFEITAHYNDLTPPENVSIAAYGTNEAFDDEDDAVAIGTQGIDQSPGLSFGGFNGVQLLVLSAVNTNAAVRFVQVHAKFLPIAGDVPLLSFAVPSNTSIYFGWRDLLALGRVDDLAVVMSTTGPTFTAAAGADFLITALVK